MAKRRSKNHNPAQVPCTRVVVGGKGFKKAAPGAKDARGCTITTTTQDMASRKVDLRKNIGATSKTVEHIEGRKVCGSDRKGTCPPPCAATDKRKTCPVQLAFDRGQPFLRFCFAKKQPGYRVDVDSPTQAVEVANKACAHWKERGSFEGYFPQGTNLKG